MARAKSTTGGALVDTVSATLAGEGFDAPNETVRPREGTPSRRGEPTDLLELTVGPDADTYGADLAVTGTLGEGGMGVVELAYQRSLRREVAIKRSRTVPPEETELRSLLREARFTGSLEHPNIVPVHAIGRSDEAGPMIVMKRIEGVTWDDVIHDADHEFWADVRVDALVRHVEITIQIAHALEYAHSRGVLHRDVKPANVLIGRFGEVMLLDWGVALAIEKVGQLSETAISGTPHYMSREMLSPESGDIGIASDVYLLAGSLRHALTGRVPHSGESMMQVLASVAMNELPPLPDDVEPELADILERAMESSPADRYASVQELRIALEDFLRHRTSARLVEVALERLSAMERAVAKTDARAVEVREHFDAARFGFEQALVGWSESTQARAGLSRAFETMITWELTRGDVESAEALHVALARHDEDTAEGLRDAIEQRASALEQSREEEAHLQEVGHEHDIRVSRRARQLALYALVVVATVGSGLLTYIGLADPPPPPEALPVPPALALIVIGVIVVWQRDVFFSNRINRIMTTNVLILFACVVIHRVHAALTHETLEMVVSRDALLVATIAAVSGAVLHRRFFAIAAIYAAAALVGAWWEASAVFVVVLAGIPSLAIVVFGGPRDTSAE